MDGGSPLGFTSVSPARPERGHKRGEARANVAGLGRLRRAPAGEGTLRCLDLDVSSAVLPAGLLALILIMAGAFFDAGSVPWQRELARPVRLFFAGITDLGKSSWELIPSGGLLLLLGLGDWRAVERPIRLFWLEISRLAVFVFGAVAASGLLANGVKFVVGRSRPANFDGLGPFAFEPFNFGYHFASFPSGHATTLGATAVVIGLMAPRWRSYVLVAAATIAFSRVVVGAHYPGDVVGGFLLGGLCAYLFAVRLARNGFALTRSRAGLLQVRSSLVRRTLSQRGGSGRVLAGLFLALANRIALTVRRRSESAATRAARATLAASNDPHTSPLAGTVNGAGYGRSAASGSFRGMTPI